MTYGQVERRDIDDLPPDLRDEAERLAAEGKEWEAWTAQLYVSDDPESEIPEPANRVRVLWAPDTLRAGINWNSDSAWTDAIDVKDALDRYVANEMLP